MVNLKSQDAYDVWQREDVNDGALAEEIFHFLRIKGYCVVGRPGDGDEACEVALEEIAELHGHGKFEQPFTEILDGLLGEEGSSEFTALDAPLGQLRAFDQELHKIWKGLRPLLSGVGITSHARAATILFRGGEASISLAPDLTEADWTTWNKVFSRAPLMMLYFLGPSEGLLELRPFRDEASRAHEVRTERNMIIILRCDVLSHRHQSSVSDFTMCSFAMSPVGISYAPPVCAQLEAWQQQRMSYLKQMEVAKMWDDRIPREWQMAMNQHYLASNPAAIRGLGARCPGTEFTGDFWKILGVGVDYVTEVPETRWLHEKYYDPLYAGGVDESSFAFLAGDFKTSVRHGQFVEGINLFDNEFFGCSLHEATTMDPQERQLLETGYECLWEAGYTRAELRAAPISVFVGATKSEFRYVGLASGLLREGGGPTSRGSASSRTSFCLGLKGRTATVDCEMASAAVACAMGAEAVCPSTASRSSWLKPDAGKDAGGGAAAAALVGGVYLCFSPIMWARFARSMSRHGRCLTFDKGAGGYVRGEGCVSACLKSYTSIVGDERVVAEEPCTGTLRGWSMSTCGKGCRLTAPGGPALREVLHRSVKLAGVAYLDVEAVECHGIGNILFDAVEHRTLSVALRGFEEDDEPLIVSSLKSQVGAQCEVSGLMSLVRVATSIRRGTMLPSIHLRVLNKSITMKDSLIAINTDRLQYRGRSSYHGLNSCGVNGMSVHLLQWYLPDLGFGREGPRARGPGHEALSFWPGATAGDLASLEDDQEYYIVGSWLEWQEPAKMVRSTSDTWSYVVTLGCNRWETFQILVNGRTDRILHPRSEAASSGVAAHGPSEAAPGLTWRIDGRASAGSRTQGNPGDQYLIKFMTSGRYRTVTWEKHSASTDVAAAMVDPAIQGTFYVVGSFNGWTFQKMEAVDLERGIHALNAELGRQGGEFQIVRNRDWSQRFYPHQPNASAEAKVLGPSAEGDEQNWLLSGGPGDAVRIEFCRHVEVEESGFDYKQVRWSLLRSTGPEPDEPVAPGSQYGILGSWDDFRLRPMKWNGRCWVFHLEIGPSGEAQHFQIADLEQPELRFFPNYPNSNPHEVHHLKGPQADPENKWTVGQHPYDRGGPGACYEIKLLVGRQHGRPRKVEWIRTKFSQSDVKQHYARSW